MTHISQVLNESLLAEMIEGGFISCRAHPEFPYSIYNYTPRCTFENKWNEVTLACRGLIVHAETGEVLARPFKKFFNHKQPGCPKIELDTRVIAYDKMDGSLGILYPEPDGKGHRIATRGVFDSPQAIRGTQIWKSNYEGRFPVYPGSTFLFEIVYPENRIVIDYGYEDLVFLAEVDIECGWTKLGRTWNWRSAEPIIDGTFADALAVPPRPNAEGLVVWTWDTNERIKIKQDDYLAMHKVVCGLNERVIWESVCAGNSNEIIAGLPDEFQGWATGVQDRIVGEVMDKEESLEKEFWAVCHSLDAGFSRKDFALKVKDSPDKWAMFSMLDGHILRPELLKRARPEANLLPSNIRCQSDDSN